MSVPLAQETLGITLRSGEGMCRYLQPKAWTPNCPEHTSTSYASIPLPPLWMPAVCLEQSWAPQFALAPQVEMLPFCRRGDRDAQKQRSELTGQWDMHSLTLRWVCNSFHQSPSCPRDAVPLERLPAKPGQQEGPLYPQI